MANEFVARNGLIALDNSAITGSLGVSGGITGSLFGTASWATNAVSASYFSGSISSAITAETASYVTSSNVYGPFGPNSILSASYAVTAAFALNAGGGGGLSGGTEYYVPVWTGASSLGTSSLFESASILKTVYNTQDVGLKLDFANNLYQLGDDGTYFGNAVVKLDSNDQIIELSANGTIKTSANGNDIGLNLDFVNSIFNLGDYGEINNGTYLVVDDINQKIQASNQFDTNGLQLDFASQLYRLGNFAQATGSFLEINDTTKRVNISGSTTITGSLTVTNGITGSLFGTASYAENTPPTFIDNFVTVGLPGSDTQYNSIKTAVDSITDASADNTYTVKVYPGVYIEDTITLPSYVAVKGESSTSTVVSASNPSASIFIMNDQTMVIDMQIQGSTAPGVSAIYYSSATTPQTNAIAYAENIRFGTNYTNATCAGSGSGNCILQCSNVKYGGYTDASLKTFDIGFRVTGSGGSIGRMQLRNVTSTNGGVAGSDPNQIFALADAPGCAFIVNGCLLTRAVGAATGTGFKVYNGGALRLTAVNFQRWTKGIWAPQTGSAPSIDAIALNFENCTTDVAIEHTGSTGKVSGTDNFLKTQIALTAPLYEVGQDPRRITVAKKGGDFTSISASVAYITDSAENNRYVIEVGPGEFTEKQIDMRNKPYVAILGSDIQTTVIVPSGSGAYDQVLIGPTNELSFLSLKGNNVSGYSAITAEDLGEDFAQIHKVSIYNHDYGIKVLGNISSSTFYGEYIDINGPFSYGIYVSSSNGNSALASMENYYLFPSASAAIGNYGTGPSSSIALYTALFQGDATPGSTAIKIERGVDLEANGLDIQMWDYGIQVPNTSPAVDFKIVGTMIHDSSTYDFDVQNSSTLGRFQGVATHTKINNNSPDFYWNFLDDIDGENDITRNLAVTFADGTHTDASTLIFNGSPMGVMSGGEITISGSLTITTAAGFGYCENPLDNGVYKRIDWSDSTITLSPNTNNYIYINYNEVLSAAGTAPSSLENIILGRVVTNDTGIEFIDQTPYDGAHMSNKISKFNREALGPVFAEGSIVTENVTPFNLDVTQGSYYFSENNFLPAGTSSINLTQYYQSASVWARYTSSTVPNDVYASGSALIAMSASYYTKHTVYLVGQGVDEEYFLVINGNQYSSLVSAENADLPTTPTYFSDGVVPLAAVYVQSGSANITQIQDIRPIIGFRAAGVNASSVHGNLLGLSADDHTQYLRVDGFREMTGDLGLGGNDLYNFALLSGSGVTASSATIDNINGTTANITSITGSLLGNASSATTASYVLNAVSASFASTASYADNFTVAGTLTAQTIVVQTITSSTDFVTGSTRFGSIVTNTHQFTGSVSITGSLNSPNITGSLQGTASWANNAISASFASTASFAPLYVLTSATSSMLAPYVLNSQTSSFVTNAQTSSFVLNSQTSSMLAPYLLVSQTSSFVTNAQTSSFVLNSQTSSMTVLSASFASTASFAPLYVLTSATASMLAPYLLVSQTSSFVTNSQTSSFVLNSQTSSMLAPYVLNSQTSSFVTNSQTSSFVLNSQTSSMSVLSASFAATASSAPLYVLTSATASMLAPYVLTSQTSSFVLNSQTSSMSVATASFATSSISASYASVAQTLLGSVVSASYAATASIATTASFAISASWAPSTGGSGLTTKAGSVANTSFTGNPKKATVTFGTAFTDTNYAVTVTGEDARSWTIESKVAGSFVISANSNTNLSGTTYWIATAYGETT